MQKKLRALLGGASRSRSPHGHGSTFLDKGQHGWGAWLSGVALHSCLLAAVRAGCCSGLSFDRACLPGIWLLGSTTFSQHFFRALPMLLQHCACTQLALSCASLGLTRSFLGRSFIPLGLGLESLVSLPLPNAAAMPLPVPDLARPSKSSAETQPQRKQC
jgi:hypothetical protein